MKITPLDIDQQEFSTVFRTDQGEVRASNQVSRQLEELVRDLKRHEQLRRQEAN